MFTHLSLFSGIGGLDLAAEAAGFKTVAQVEIDAFANTVLEKNFPEVARWKDVREFTGNDFYKRTGLQTVNVLSGGFPCQPHSLAGKRLAFGDSRDLWGEMRRVICEIRPEWVVGENVLGLLSSENGRFFGGILRDFSEMGYNVSWGVLSAAAVGAVHKRERVAIIAHTDSKFMDGIRCRNSDYSHRGKAHYANHRGKIRDNSEQLPGFPSLVSERNSEFIKPLITREDDGFSNAMDRNKALGNAVVPQCFYLVFKAIYDSMKQNYGGFNDYT